MEDMVNNLKNYEAMGGNGIANEHIKLGKGTQFLAVPVKVY